MTLLATVQGSEDSFAHTCADLSLALSKSQGAGSREPGSIVILNTLAILVIVAGSKNSSDNNKCNKVEQQYPGLPKA